MENVVTMDGDGMPWMNGWDLFSDAIRPVPWLWIHALHLPAPPRPPASARDHGPGAERGD